MKLVAIKKSEQNGAAIDPWTAVHAAMGLAFGLLGVDFKVSMALATAYEVFEQGLERTEVGHKIFKASGPETLPNVLVDLAVFAAGHWVATRWNES